MPEFELRPEVRTQRPNRLFWGTGGQPMTAEDVLAPQDIAAPFRHGAVALGEELARPITDTAKLLRGKMSEQEKENYLADRIFGLLGGGAGSVVKPLLAGGAKLIPAIMAGPMAATADRKALAVAKFLERAGDSRDEIYKKTGWLRDDDSNWKFWISDKEFKVKPEAKEMIGLGQKEFRWGEIFHNPPVSKAYPGLKDLPVRIDDPNMPPNTAAGHYPGAPSEGGLPEHRAYGTFGKRMGFRSERLFGNDKMAASDPVHETGHAVELYEGWTSGGGKTVKALSNKLEEMIKSGQITRDQALEIARPLSKLSEYELYKLVGSERNQFNANRRFVHPKLENLPPFYTKERKGSDLVFSVEDIDPQQAEKTPIFEGINGKYYHLVPVDQGPGKSPKMEVQPTWRTQVQGAPFPLEDLTSAKPQVNWPWPMYDPKAGR